MENYGQYLMVCDFENHRIQVFNATNGAFIKSHGLDEGQFKRPHGICISASGQIIVCEYGNHCVQVFHIAKIAP